MYFKEKIKYEKDYQKLGDINSGVNGNFYVVWGNDNKDNGDYNTQAVLVSKYNSDGVHIKTTGFAGESPMAKAEIHKHLLMPVKPKSDD